MTIRFRPYLLGISLLVSGVLGLPGAPDAEPPPESLLDSLWSDPGDPAPAAGGPVGDTEPAPSTENEAIALSDGSGASLPLESPVPTPPPASNDPLSAAALPAARPVYQVQDNDHVRRFVEHFQTGDRRQVVERWLGRAGRYLPMIVEVFRQKGLPEELVFTAMIESGFNPVAVSRAGAKGLWQFMAPTARRYGLRVDRWLDERLDPEKSTVAAANYLRDLHVQFGSWELAKAAYNAGELRVSRAIERMGTSDFWALIRGRLLKQETKDFVPAIHAATLIGREPERYGFVVTPEEPLRYEVVEVPRGTPLKRVAALSGIPLEVLEALNAELRLKQTPPDAVYLLKVPVGRGDLVRTALDRDAGTQRYAGRPTKGKPGSPGPGVHVVKTNETVDRIAKRYGVSVADIVRWNDLDDRARIFPGDRLRVARGQPEEELEQGGFR
jgi:membrane-bound lytic murein transglycosylase D